METKGIKNTADGAKQALFTRAQMDAFRNCMEKAFVKNNVRAL